jgi:hypothetical protein
MCCIFGRLPFFWGTVFESRIWIFLDMNDSYKDFDVRTALTNNRLSGLWRLLKGYRLTYFFAICFLGIAALSKTLTFLLLRYFIDEVLGRQYPSLAQR